MPITPTPGSDAVAAGMSLVPGSGLAADIEEYDNQTRDYLANGPAYWKAGVTVPQSKGGTGGTSAPTARTALGLGTAAVEDATKFVTNDSAATNQVKLRWDGAAFRIVMRIDSSDVGQIANVGDLGGIATANANANGRVSKTGDTMTGDLFLPNSSAASSGWTSAFINSDGRVCKGASALRFKKYVTEHDPLELGDIFPAWHRFQMKADGTLPAEGKWRYGPIADHMAAHPDQEPFVVYDAAGEVESVDFTGLLLAQAAQLHAEQLRDRADLDIAADLIRAQGELIAQLTVRLDALDGGTK